MIRLILFSLFAITSLQAFGQNAEKKWFKGNLHTHSYWSDGDEFPEMVMDWYKTHGYQFVALSDHNTLDEGEKWKLITKNKTYEGAFENYRAKYGDKWVTYKIDTGRIHVKLKTFAEYKPLFEDNNFLILHAEEISAKFENKYVHMGVINVQSLIPAQGGKSLQEVMQNNLNAVIRQRKETGVPVMQHLNHPNFYYSISTQNIIDLDGERFFEVYNGHHLVHNYGDSVHMGTEAMWDLVNIAYIKNNKPMLFGLANDDTHNYHLFGPTYSNAGRGWVMVSADELTAGSLITAMEAGDFYASTGVTLTEAGVRDNTLHVVVASEPHVKYTIEFIGVRKGEEKSSVLQTISGTSAQFKLTKDYLFVRAKVKSSKVKTNPIAEDEPEAAWVQPVSIY